MSSSPTVAVVMTGLSAAGKSSVGRELAQTMGLAFLDKDDFLEARFGDDAHIDADERTRRSRLADHDLHAAASSAGSVVIASFWRHAGESTSGTPTGWLSHFDAVVEVRCVCPPEVAIDRFLARRRHPGHGDGRWTRETGLANFRRVAAMGALGVGSLVVAHTEPWPSGIEFDELSRQVTSALTRAQGFDYDENRTIGCGSRVRARRDSNPRPSDP